MLLLEYFDSIASYGLGHAKHVALLWVVQSLKNLMRKPRKGEIRKRQILLASFAPLRNSR